MRKLCLFAVAAGLFMAPSLHAVVKDAAFLQGSSLANGDTQLTSATPTAISWTERSSIDPGTYDHSFATPGQLVVKKAGDYLVAATMPVIAISDADNRPSQAFEIYVNGEVAPGTVGASGYIRNQPRNVNMQNETSNHAHTLLTGLAEGDVIEVRAYKTAQPGLATAIQTASLYVELVDGSRTVFAGLSDDSTNAANLNPSFEEDGEDPAELTWNSTRKDSGISHSDGSASINLSSGNYLVFVNVPLQASIQRAAPGLEVLLDGDFVKGGTARQGYNRNASGHNESSLQWSGIIEVSGNQTLTLQTIRTANVGETKIMDGKHASVFIEAIEDNGLHFTSATDVDDLDNPFNWNPADKTALVWNSAEVSDSGTYNQGDTSITVREAGSYLLVYQDTLQSTVERPNPRITVEVNGGTVPGAETKSHYIRSADGHNESSGSLVFLLEDLAANDEITVSTQREGQTGEVFIDEFQLEGAILGLIKKESIDVATIASAPRVSLFSGGLDGFQASIQNFATSVDESSIAVTLNGESVTPEVSTAGGLTSITYSFAEVPDSLSSHVVGITYSDSDGSSHSANFSFVVDTIFTRVPASFASSGVDTGSNGFVANVSQISANLHGTSSAGAEQQLAGAFVDEFGEPYINEAGPLTANDWQFSPAEIELVNLEQDGGTAGNFTDANGFQDDFIPGIPGFEGSTDGIAAEFLTFLELSEGFHTLGVNSDDGFRVTTGPSVMDQAAIELGVFEGGRGSSDSIFSILVEEPGIYPVRLLWYEGTGGANVEFFSVDEDGEKILINDRSNNKAIKAYSAGSTRPYISEFSPRSRALTDSLQYIINDGDVDVVDSSVNLTLNGQSVTPEVSKSGGVTTVTYTNPDGFFPGGDHEAVLSYQESGDPSVTRVFNHAFGIPSGQPAVLLDGPFAYWRLGETEGNSVINEISGLHVGTYQNNPGLGAERLVVGDGSSAVLFDASQGHAFTLANHGDINNLTGNGGWTEKTVEFWFKARNLPNNDPPVDGVPITGRQVIFEQGGATRGINAYLVGTQDGDNPTEAELWFNILNRAETAWGGTIPYNEDQGLSPNDEAIAVGTTIQADTLYHAVMVFTGDSEDASFEGGIVGYLNGEPFGEKIGANVLFNHTDGIAIGRRNNEVSFHDYIVNGPNGADIFNSGNNLYYDGWLDEFALYNVALSAEQVKAHYEAGLQEVPVDTPPVIEPPLPPVPPTSGAIDSIVQNGDGSVTITFTGSLTSAATVDGPFTAVDGASSPHTVAPSGDAQFYIAQ